MKKLEINQKVFCSLYGGKYGYITNITGEQTPETCISIMGNCGVTGGSANIDIQWKNGGTSNVPEALIHQSVQWKTFDVLSNEEVAEYDLEFQAAKDELHRKAQMKALKNEADRKHFLDTYSSYLIQTSPEIGSFKAAKKNIRVELKKEFPDVKFSIKQDRYDCILIKWEDGPTSEEVEKITNKYEDHENDWSGDYRDYNPSEFNSLFGGSKYIFTTRDMSAEVDSKFSHWAKKQFNKGNTYDSHDSDNLSYQLFVHCSLPKSKEFEIVMNDEMCGLSHPKTFWTVKF